MAAIGAEQIDFAVLDINLRDEMVFPAADALHERGITFIFATGYEQSVVPDRFANVIRWEKPFDVAALARSLPALKTAVLSWTLDIGPTSWYAAQD